MPRKTACFATLKKNRIAKYSSLDGTDFASCKGQESEALVESLCVKTDDLKMGCPQVKKRKLIPGEMSANTNVRKRICLSLMNVRSGKIVRTDRSLYTRIGRRQDFNSGK